MDAFNQIFYMIDTLEPGGIYYYATMKLLCNLNKIKYMNIVDTAELCAVSQSTMSKLIKKLGFDSFSAFKIAVAESRSLRERPAALTVSQDTIGAFLDDYLSAFKADILDMCASLDISAIQTAANTLYQAEQVALFTFNAYPLLSLSCELLIDQKKISILKTKQDELDFVSAVPAHCAIICLTQGAVEWSKKKSALIRAKEAGASIIAICSETGFNPGGIFDHVLAYDRRENFLNNSITMFYIHLLTGSYIQHRGTAGHPKNIPFR